MSHPGGARMVRNPGSCRHGRSRRSACGGAGTPTLEPTGRGRGDCRLRLLEDPKHIVHLGLHEDDKEQGLVYSLVDTKALELLNLEKDGAQRNTQTEQHAESRALGHLLVGILFCIFL